MKEALYLILLCVCFGFNTADASGYHVIGPDPDVPGVDRVISLPAGGGPFMIWTDVDGRTHAKAENGDGTEIIRDVDGHEYTKAPKKPTAAAGGGGGGKPPFYPDPKPILGDASEDTDKYKLKLPITDFTKLLDQRELQETIRTLGLFNEASFGDKGVIIHIPEGAKFDLDELLARDGGGIKGLLEYEVPPLDIKEIEYVHTPDQQAAAGGAADESVSCAAAGSASEEEKPKED